MEAITDANIVEFEIFAEKLHKKDLFGKCNPFMRLYREKENGMWREVYKTEVNAGTKAISFLYSPKICQLFALAYLLKLNSFHTNRILLNNSNTVEHHTHVHFDCTMLYLAFKLNKQS